MDQLKRRAVGRDLERDPQAAMTCDQRLKRPAKASDVERAVELENDLDQVRVVGRRLQCAWNHRPVCSGVSGHASFKAGNRSRRAVSVASSNSDAASTCARRASECSERRARSSNTGWANTSRASTARPADAARWVSRIAEMLSPPRWKKLSVTLTCERPRRSRVTAQMIFSAPV